MARVPLALRSTARRRGATSMVVAALAFGVGANIAILLVVSSALVAGGGAAAAATAPLAAFRDAVALGQTRAAGVALVAGCLALALAGIESTSRRRVDASGARTLAGLSATAGLAATAGMMSAIWALSLVVRLAGGTVAAPAVGTNQLASLGFALAAGMTFGGAPIAWRRVRAVMTRRPWALRASLAGGVALTLAFGFGASAFTSRTPPPVQRSTSPDVLPASHVVPCDGTTPSAPYNRERRRAPAV